VLRFSGFLSATDGNNGSTGVPLTGNLTFQADGANALLDWSLCLWQAGCVAAGTRLALPEVIVEDGTASPDHVDDIGDDSVHHGPWVGKGRAATDAWTDVRIL